MKKKLSFPTIILLIATSILIATIISFAYQIWHGEYYDLNADYQTTYEPWTIVINTEYDYDLTNIDNQGQIELIDNQNLLLARYSFTSRQLFDLLQQGTDATITLTEPNGRTFEAILEYHIMLGLIVNSPYLSWRSFSFDNYLSQTLSDYPTINPDTIRNCLFQFEHYFIIRDRPIIYIQGEAYTTITVSREHLLQVFDRKPFSKTVDGQTLYYIGSYSQVHIPTLHRDVYLSADQINIYLTQMANADQDYVIIQSPLPDSKLEWSNLSLKMPTEEYKAYVTSSVFLIALIIVLISYIVISNPKLLSNFLKYMHLDGDDDKSCGSPTHL